MSASLLLIDTKFPHNVGAALRAASCFGAQACYWSGDRVSLDVGLGQRLPREERMKAYRDVTLRHVEEDRPVTAATIDVMLSHEPNPCPVAVELTPGATPLHLFEHPEDALYVFGPEDGSLPKGIRTACHRFVVIPSLHCLNLSAAAYVVLYDRAVKRAAQGIEPMPALAENRGAWHVSELETVR